jgi:hypothetical protein
MLILAPICLNCQGFTSPRSKQTEARNTKFSASSTSHGCPKTRTTPSTATCAPSKRVPHERFFLEIPVPAVLITKTIETENCPVNSPRLAVTVPSPPSHTTRRQSYPTSELFPRNTRTRSSCFANVTQSLSTHLGQLVRHSQHAVGRRSKPDHCLQQLRSWRAQDPRGFPDNTNDGSQGHIGFLIGCSYSFKHALTRVGYPPKHTLSKPPSFDPMSKTTVPLNPVEEFSKAVWCS